MQAIRVDPAAPSGVSLGDAPDPAPRPDEALVAVELFTIVARNFDHAARLPVGSVPGFDTVGVIVRAADDGSGPPVGTRVASAVTGNAWAALRAVPTSELAVVPTGVDPGLASALVVPGVSALRAIRRLGALLGRQLLVTGATGAVGHFAIQLGKLAGAEVIASVRDLGSESRLRDLGATAVVAGLGGIAVPVYGVIDTVGGPQLAEAFNLLEDGGVIQSVGSSSGQPTTFAPYQMIGPHRRRIEGFWAGNRFGADLAALLDLAAAGRLTLLDGERADWYDIESIARRLRAAGPPRRMIVAPRRAATDDQPSAS